MEKIEAVWPRTVCPGGIVDLLECAAERVLELFWNSNDDVSDAVDGADESHG